jgi:hypothetical protein
MWPQWRQGCLMAIDAAAFYHLVTETRRYFKDPDTNSTLRRADGKCRLLKEGREAFAILAR